MIRSISLNNFKCFKEIEISLSNLNVLAGINGMGKSTLIQALLLLRQSFEQDNLKNGIHLNGEFVNIGTGQDLLYRYSEEDSISISIQHGVENEKWVWKYNKISDFLELDVSSAFTGNFAAINLFGSRFEYISAERVGPKRIYDKSYYDIQQKRRLGNQGELAAHFFLENSSMFIKNEYAYHNESTGQTLEMQTNAWLHEISPELSIDVKDFSEAGLVGLSYNFPDSMGGGNSNAVNTGFGLTYIFPVIIAILKAEKGDLLIIENPEAHLHPKGQRKMGELIAGAAAGGVQIIVETHSDHLLNGLRLSVKNNKINPDQISLNYFYRSHKNGNISHYKTSPEILSDGSLSDWPEGFFDEWDIAIDELF